MGKWSKRGIQVMKLHQKSMAQSKFSVQTEMLNQILSLVEAFRAFDAENDGSITDAELRGIMSSLGYNLSEQDVKAMMRQGDTNRDGLLSIDEFLDMNTKEMELGDLATFLRTAFETLNIDGDSGVTGEELFEVVKAVGIRLSLEDCQGIIASMDVNGNGAVSFEDFKVIVNSL